MKKNTIIVSHKFLTQPDDDLVIHLNKKKVENVLHIRHSFSDTPDRKSYYTWYKEGRIHKERETKDYKSLPEPLIYIKEFAFTLIWTIKTRIKWDNYIGMDGLCSIFGFIIKALRRTQNVIYWAIDFVPNQRFGSTWKNTIYKSINTYGYRNADEMWDLGAKMTEAREKYMGFKKNDYKKHRVVPYGLWIDRLQRFSYEKCDKNTIVFMGHLLEKQGAQIVLESLQWVQEKIPNIHYKIIGGGNYKEKLEETAKKLKVENICIFMGKIQDIKELEREVAKSAVAVAPYIAKLDTWTKYADPGKVKTYIGCGVPTLLTNVPWNAKEIEEKKCGMIITEDPKEVAEKIISLLEERKNKEYRENAKRYAISFDYKTIFNNIESL